MYRELRNYLRAAGGESQFVLAINVDIRGFSSFFADSSQSAAYLSFVYTRILDDYFPEHSFFKPTGDGLIIVRTLDRESIPESVSESVAAATRLDAEFGRLAEDDALLNFATPAHVGIGLARGTATRLSADGKALDYSGRPLNLASRLMDVARPHGVVFDESLLSGLEDHYDDFASTPVFIKGIADSVPIRIRSTTAVRIPQTNRRPFGASTFSQDSESVKKSGLVQRAPQFIHTLEKEPFDLDEVVLHVVFPAADSRGNKHPELHRTMQRSATTVRRGPAGKWQALFDYASIVEVLERAGVKGTWMVKLRLEYPIAADAIEEEAHGAAPADIEQ